MAVLGPLALIVCLATAWADSTEERVATLREGQPYKVRLSAALWLSRRPASDVRAVSSLVDAVRGDPAATVRRVSALALGELVSAQTPGPARARALAALDRAASEDRDRDVRQNARRALDQIRARLAPEPPAGERGGMFVHVGPASDPDGKLPRGAAARLVSAVRGAVARKAPHYALSGEVLPTRAELRRSGRRGFMLEASVTSLQGDRRGTSLTVTCKVQVRVTAWGGSDAAYLYSAEQTASATGSGQVTASARAADAARVDCVTAVAEEITVRQVMPFLRRFEGRADAEPIRGR